MKRVDDIYAKKNKINIEHLSQISDEMHTLFYRFTPASFNPEGAPLLIILHGHGTKSATKFQHENWNVLTPVDHFGYKGDGCWWLGEEGDFFVARLLQKLIQEIVKEYQCENNIYFYGSSMGGYGAIYHGILANARAIYANVPQVKFFPSRYFKTFKKNGEYIFNMKESLPIENNLLNMLNIKDKFPVFYLCENVCENKNHLEGYLKEHTLAFLNKCYEYQIKTHVEILPQEGHTKNYGIGEVLEKFIKFKTPIKENKCQKTLNLLSSNISWYDVSNKSILLCKNNILEIKDTFKESLPFVAYYTSSNSRVTQKIPSNNLIDISLFSKIYLNINLSYKEFQDISIFIQLFDETSLVSSTNYVLSEEKNNIDIAQLHDSIKYMKLLFRISSSVKKLNVQISKAEICVESIKKEKKLDNNTQMNLIPKIQHLELKSEQLFSEGEKTYYIKKNAIGLHFYLNYKKGKKLLIALPGATDRNKKFYNFQRFTWSENIKCSFMSVLDPTITEGNNLSIGWFQGKHESYALDSVIDVLKNMIKENNIDEKDIIFFGSSAGGFSSLKIANYFTESKIIVINPQIYLYNYAKNPYNELLSYSYPDMSKEEVKSKYGERLEVNIDYSKRNASIYYYQNIADKHHMEKHLKPYLANIAPREFVGVNANEVIPSEKKLYVLYYNDPENGHSPPNKERTLAIFTDILDDNIGKGYKWIY